MKSKVKLSYLKELLIMSSVLPAYRAMTYKVDSKVTRLSAELKSLIEYEIGEDITELVNSKKALTDKILQPFREQLMGLSGEDQIQKNKELDGIAKIAIDSSEELRDLARKEEALWAKEVTFDLEDHIPIYLVEDIDYSSKFEGNKNVEIYGRTLSVDGYQAFLTLMAKNILTIKEE